MLAGAFGGALGTFMTGSPLGGFVVAICLGMLGASVLAVLAVRFAVNQIVCGIAINLVIIGLTAYLARLIFGLDATTQTLPGFSPVAIPILSGIPIVGPVFFNQDPLVYLMYVICLFLFWLLYRSEFGLQIRATGENPAAADTAGVPVFYIRFVCVVLSGALAGIGGAYIVLSQVFVFTEHMSAGKGFIALAAIILGRWDPIGAVAASWFFGFCEALQLRLQFANPSVPYQFFSALPYIASILALIGVYGRFKPPTAVGIPYRRESKA
jgi:general nucleoside transport system permease protein